MSLLCETAVLQVNAKLALNPNGVTDNISQKGSIGGEEKAYFFFQILLAPLQLREQRDLLYRTSSNFVLIILNYLLAPLSKP